MNYALIGCGRIATNHIKAALNNQLHIVALCDTDSSHIDCLLKKHSLEQDHSIQRYTDYKRMLAEHPELTLIAIATESGKHAAIALDCIDAGKHVIVEKPLALSMADADEIIRRANKNHVLVCACHQNRFNLAVQKLRQAVDHGRFGRISHGTVHVRWNRDHGYYDQAPWRGTWQEDGGCLMNQCIHGIDLLIWLLGGKVKEVYGTTSQCFHDYLEAEDVGLAVLTFDNGTVATIEGTVNVYPKNLEETLYIFGETGTVKLGGTATNNIDLWQFHDMNTEDADNQGLQEFASNVYGNGHTSLYGDMLDAIKTGRDPYVNGQAGRDALEIVLAIYKSKQTGLPVRLPLTNFASTDMVGTFQKK